MTQQEETRLDNAITRMRHTIAFVLALAALLALSGNAAYFAWERADYKRIHERVDTLEMDMRIIKEWVMLTDYEKELRRSGKWRE